MRMARTAAKALVGIVLVPGLAVAQNQADKNFNDSWFWGINGGAMLFSAGLGAEETKVTAPSIGGEWLITRTGMALRLSIDQAFFDEQTAIFDPGAQGGARQVDVKDWRRYAAEIYFVAPTIGLRPYFGLGIALNVIQNAAPAGSFNSQEQMDAVYLAVDEFSSKASAVFTAGLQLSLGRAALFGQGSAMPTRNNFLLNRSAYTFMGQVGIRYNVASAIEKF